MPKNYIDLRIVLSYGEPEVTYADETEVESYRFLEGAKIKVSRTKGLTPLEVECVAEVFGQSDKYQIMLVNDSIQAISDEAERQANKEAEDIRLGYRYPIQHPRD